MKITLEKLNNTPVFVIQDDSTRWERVYGATYQKRFKRWVFPAFPPFIQKVQHDLPQIDPTISYSPEASQWAAQVKDFEGIEQKVLEAAKNFPLESYQHQLHGLMQLLYNWRYILNWEMGTGKTKVIIDLMSLLSDHRALILAPLIAIENWVDEVKVFTGGALTAVPIIGRTRKAKFGRLLQAQDADMVIVPYDTARLYGLPFLAEAVSKLCRGANQYPSPTFKKHLRQVNDAKVQKRLTEEWLRGRKVQDIGMEVQELRSGNIQWLSEIPYEVIVTDESHRIKRIQSQRTKVCLRLAALAARRYELSGTLSLGDPRDLYPQLKFLAPYVLPETWFEFCDKHVERSPWNKHIVTGYKNLHELNARLSQVSDQKKLDECVDLPDRRFETLYFNLTPGQMKDYNYAIKEMMLDVPDKSPQELQNGAIRLMKLLQICSGFYYFDQGTEDCDTCDRLRECVADGILPGSQGCTQAHATRERQEQVYGVNPKLDAFDDLLEDLLAGGHKVITWAHFTAELDAIEGRLKKKKIGYVRVDGKTTKNIKVLSTKFQEDTDVQVYLGQISTAIAINLTAAKYVIYYSRTFSLEDWLQSLGRNYRIGQKEKTVVYSLCARGTVEQQQLIALEQKEDVSVALTHKISCLTCSRYEKCLPKNILPWTEQCVLDTNVKRAVSKAGYVYPTIEGK